MKKWRYCYILLFIGFAVLGLSISDYYNKDFSKSINEVRLLENQVAELKGVLVEQTKYKSGQRFVLDNISIITEDSTKFRNDIKYIVYPDNETLENLSLGDTLTCSGKLNIYGDIRNPGEFDFRKYYHNKHIAGRAYANNKIIVNPNSDWLMIKTINQFREFVRSKLTAYSDAETTALLSALILGDRTQIDQDLRESFANVGVVHVLAVSGLHVGYVLLILMLLVRSFRIPWGWDKIFIILGLILFCIISGGRPSVIRASIMAGLYILAPILNRRSNPWNIIATAAFLILIINPNSLFDLGFQLSFTAVISIIYFYKLIVRNLSDGFKPVNIQNNVVRWLWSLFLVSLSAQIGTIPVVALYFGRLPLIAVIANLIVIPLIGLFVALGFIKLMIFWIPPISFLMDQINWLTKEAIYGSIALFDKIPFASIATPQFNWIDLIIYISVIGVGISLLQKQFGRVLIFCMLLINFVLWPKLYNNKGLDIMFLDMGNNEAAIIKTKNDKGILLNNGVLSMFSDDISRKIKPALKYFKIEEIDEFIRPRGNSNFKVGTVKLVESYPINHIWDTSFDSTSSFDSYFRNLVDMRNISYSAANSGDVVELGDESFIQFLLPNDKLSVESNYALNISDNQNSMLVFDRLNNNEIDILFDHVKVLNSNILKMSYPKIMDDKLESLIYTVDPEITIITGRPTSKNNPTVEELQNIIPNQLLFTDLVGSVWLFSDGDSVEVKDWK